jgi:hypothetical protein
MFNVTSMAFGGDGDGTSFDQIILCQTETDCANTKPIPHSHSSFSFVKVNRIKHNDQTFSSNADKTTTSKHYDRTVISADKAKSTKHYRDLVHVDAPKVG